VPENWVAFIKGRIGAFPILPFMLVTCAFWPLAGVFLPLTEKVVTNEET
jgi:hypothetical protein